MILPLQNPLDNGICDFFRGSRTSQVLRLDPVNTYSFDSLHELLPRFFLTQPFEHLRCCPKSCDRVGDSFACDIESRPVDRLEHYTEFLISNVTSE